MLGYTSGGYRDYSQPPPTGGGSYGGYGGQSGGSYQSSGSGGAGGGGSWGQNRGQSGGYGGGQGIFNSNLKCCCILNFISRYYFLQHGAHKARFTRELIFLLILAISRIIFTGFMKKNYVKDLAGNHY